MKKYYGQFDPSVDRFLFERYFPDESIRGIFVECGAFDGQTDSSCKFFEETMGWTGYNIEPLPWMYEQLCVKRPASKNFNFALSRTEGEAVFRAVDHPQLGINCNNGSLEHMPQHSKWLKEAGCTFVDVPVRLRTWRDFVESERISRVDLFVLDVEGHELSVLDGMKGSPVLPDIFCVEIGHLNFNTVRDAVESLGYQYDISSFVNAFFIRSDRVPLFAHRRGADGVRSHFGSMIEGMQAQNAALRQELSLAQSQLDAISRSRAWRLVQRYRRLRGDRAAAAPTDVKSG